MDPAASPRSGRRTRVIAAATVGTLILLIGSFALGRASMTSVPSPSNTSAEAGFARDMQEHHLQAVDMAMIIRDSSDDDAVRMLAYDIATSQAQQAGQMFGWLESWGLSQAPAEPSMTWMARPATIGTSSENDAHPDGVSHTPGASMPGMATFDQLNALRAAQGIDAERMFLELMIEHHQGGLEMAHALLERSAKPVVTSLAESIVVAQASEIDLMRLMLAARE
ncbi:MAG: DUF305 domain-containing protein, partial [Rhodoglobus sp.]|nr:DUF305 domain-containing protein [Rhodoglobus sp.]